MKKSVLTTKLLFLMTVFLISSCDSDSDILEQEIVQEQIVSQKIIEKLQKAGFYTAYGLHKFEDGYIVENDIFLTEAQIDEQIAALESDAKHYRTNNLVNVPPGQTRTLNVDFAPVKAILFRPDPNANGLIVSVDIKNNGNDFANNTNVKIYLSRNRTLDSQDLLVVERNVNFRPRQVYGVGDYVDYSIYREYDYIICVADPNNTIPETNEGNNKKSFYATPFSQVPGPGI